MGPEYGGGTGGAGPFDRPAKWRISRLDGRRAEMTDERKVRAVAHPS